MIINVLSIQPFVLYIKLFIIHFLCVKDVRPCHIQEVISQHLFGIFTKFFQYSKAHALLFNRSSSLSSSAKMAEQVIVLSSGLYDIPGCVIITRKA